MEFIKFDVIDSTNKYLKENYNKLNHNTIVSALHQTNGRGRGNRVWEDNDDLLFSVLLKDNLNNISNLSLLIASSIYKTFKKLYNIESSIKWPNDIMFNNKKIVGILLESVISSKIECVIIGVGINCNTMSFSDDLLVKASSLKKELGIVIDKDELLKEIMNQFEKDLNEFNKGNQEYLNIIRNNFYLRDKEVTFTYNNKIVKGKCLDISSNGNILIESEGHILSLNSGEVSLSSVYKK